MNKSPMWLRAWRLLRLVFHVVAGVVTVFACFRFWSPQRKMVAQQRWGREFLQILGVGIEAPTSLVTPGSLLVANHISWVDILVFLVCYPIHFVSKSEVGDWPLIGYMVRESGTILLRRNIPSQARFVNAEITRRLERGDNIMVFPEGTTTDGTEVLPFFSPLFQPAISTKRKIYPVSLDYVNMDGSLSMAPAYPLGVTLPQTIWRLVSQKCTIAKVHMAQPLSPKDGVSRKELAQQARDAVIQNRCHYGDAAVNDSRWGDAEVLVSNG